MVQTHFSSELFDSVRLSLVSGVGPLLRKALVERFGSPAAVLAAAKDELQCVDGIGPKIAARIVAARDEIDAEAELQLAGDHGIDVLTESDVDYPQPLKQIHDPPGVLFRRGRRVPQDDLAVAIEPAPELRGQIAELHSVENITQSAPPRPRRRSPGARGAAARRAGGSGRGAATARASWPAATPRDPDWA